MLVCFKLNLGRKDAATLSVNHLDCTDGASLDVPDDVAEVLISRGFAVVVHQAPPDKTIKGIPEAPSISGAETTKPEPVIDTPKSKPSKSAKMKDTDSD